MIRIVLIVCMFLALTSFDKDSGYIKKAEQEFAAGEYVKANASYIQAFAMDNIDTSSQQNICKECARIQLLAKTMLENGEEAKAVDYFDKLLRLNPKDPEALSFIEKYNSSHDRADSNYSSRHIVNVYNYDGETMLFFANPDLKEMTYPEAVNFCNRLNVGGQSGWRLPTMEELLLYYYDFPDEKGKLIWVGYKGVLVNDKQLDYYEQNTNMRYCPCIDGYNLIVHPYHVNFKNEIVSGKLEKHKVIPIKIN